VGDQIKGNEMGKACITFGVEQKYIQDFGGETWRAETTGKTSK